MTTLETLKAARKLITPDGAWTQGWFAKNYKGEKMKPDDPNAICWCSWGALLAVSDADEKPLKLLREQTVIPVIDFNDAPGRTHDEVLRAFDEAIAKLEAA